MELTKRERKYLGQLHRAPNERGLQTEVMLRLKIKEHNTLTAKMWQYHKLVDKLKYQDAE